MSTLSWNPHSDFEFKLPDKEPKMCIHARDLDAWIKEHIQAVLQSPDPVAINQSKLRLLDRYFDHRAAVTKAHRDCVGERGHRCIFHVFECAYQQLKLCELKLTPPLLFVPPTPPPPTPLQVPGIFLGMPDAEDVNN